jgi:hypothetical protein
LALAEPAWTYDAGRASQSARSSPGADVLTDAGVPTAVLLAVGDAAVHAQRREPSWWGVLPSSSARWSDVRRCCFGLGERVAMLGLWRGVRPEWRVSRSVLDHLCIFCEVVRLQSGAMLALAPEAYNSSCSCTLESWERHLGHSSNEYLSSQRK